MGISVIGGAPAPTLKLLNTSQVFTASGNWIAPAGVTYAHVAIRGGNGTFGGFYFNGSNYGSTNGTDGGTTTAFSKSAAGGMGSRSSLNASPTSGSTQAVGAESTPAEMSFYQSVTPGTSYPIVIGTGTGAYAVISWAV